MPVRRALALVTAVTAALATLSASGAFGAWGTHVGEKYDGSIVWTKLPTKVDAQTVVTSRRRRRCKTFINGRAGRDRVRRKVMFIVRLRSRWCYDSRQTRGLGRQQLLFERTGWGEYLGWEWRGEDKGQRVNGSLRLAGRRRAGYDVYRVGSVELCPPGKCIKTAYVPHRHFLYFDGHADAMEDPKAPDN